MYQPTEHFAKAYQEKLLREARPESKPASTTLLSRLFGSLFSTKDIAPAHQPKARETRDGVKPPQAASFRG
jgi:hypothetical protein